MGIILSSMVYPRYYSELRVCEVVDIFDSFSGCDLRKPSVVYGLYNWGYVPDSSSGVYGRL